MTTPGKIQEADQRWWGVLDAAYRSKASAKAYPIGQALNDNEQLERERAGQAKLPTPFEQEMPTKQDAAIAGFHSDHPGIEELDNTLPPSAGAMAVKGHTSNLKDGGSMRSFETGATRDTQDGKLDYEGFLSPLVLEAFSVYMNHHRQTPSGLRASDNWQKGIPQNAYMKSAWRHFVDWWRYHRGYAVKEGIVWALCGLMFNLQGYLHELLKSSPKLLDNSAHIAERLRDNHD